MTAIAGSECLSAGIAHVTPGVAKDWLRHNRRNRTITPGRVKRLSRALRRGEWAVAQPIAYDSEGTLIDGQHRLLAVISANRPADFLVIKGYAPGTTFGKMDDTLPRKLAHWLHQNGEAKPQTLATVLRMAFIRSTGRNPLLNTHSHVILTGPEAIDFLDDHPEIRHAVIASPGTKNTYLSEALCCYLYYLFAESDATLADHFFVELVQNRNEAEYDPLHLLRERLKSNRHAKEKLNRAELAALVIKTWNAVKADRPVRHLRWTSIGPKAERFPEVSD